MPEPNVQGPESSHGEGKDRTSQKRESDYSVKGLRFDSASGTERVELLLTKDPH